MDRRKFLKSSCLTTTALLGLKAYSREVSASTMALIKSSNMSSLTSLSWNGELRSDPDNIINLPIFTDNSSGLLYRVVSVAGSIMSDGLVNPNRCDGMAAFSLPSGNYALIKNHETSGYDSSLDIDRSYRSPQDKGAYDGGTTTLELTPSLDVIREHRSLSGTIVNCAGGATPWGTWISCEETYNAHHGYAFEVDPKDTTLKAPRRLTPMGRFKREAIAIDTSTKIVHQTEDSFSGCFYRFIPDQPSLNDLTLSGKQQALKIPNILDTTNSNGFIKVGDDFAVEWVDINDPSASITSQKDQAKSLGATIFCRGEGICMGEDSIFFVSTTGGPGRLGQIWEYKPSVNKIKLFFQSNNKNQFWRGDNIIASPWGDLIVAEDNNSGACKLVGIKPNGQTYTLASVSASSSELAGICFSPDGKVMFFNIQTEGLTIAVISETGTWEEIENLTHHS